MTILSKREEVGERGIEPVARRKATRAACSFSSADTHSSTRARVRPASRTCSSVFAVRPDRDRVSQLYQDGVEERVPVGVADHRWRVAAEGMPGAGVPSKVKLADRLGQALGLRREAMGVDGVCSMFGFQSGRQLARQPF